MKPRPTTLPFSITLIFIMFIYHHIYHPTTLWPLAGFVTRWYQVSAPTSRFFTHHSGFITSASLSSICSYRSPNYAPQCLIYGYLNISSWASYSLFQAEVTTILVTKVTRLINRWTLFTWLCSQVFLFSITCVKPFTPDIVKSKIEKCGKILKCVKLKNKQHRSKILLNSFPMNGLTFEVCP